MGTDMSVEMSARAPTCLQLTSLVAALPLTEKTSMPLSALATAMNLPFGENLRSATRSKRVCGGSSTTPSSSASSSSHLPLDLSLVNLPPMPTAIIEPSGL